MITSEDIERIREMVREELYDLQQKAITPMFFKPPPIPDEHRDEWWESTKPAASGADWLATQRKTL